jgi:hypothetical protein
MKLNHYPWRLGAPAKLHSHGKLERQGGGMALLDRAMTCPHCAAPLTPAEIRTLAAKLNASLRRTWTGAGGRPRSKAPRCACGAMTAKRAAARGHVCRMGASGWS